MTGKELFAARERLGFRKSEMMRKLGVTRVTYNAYETGQNQIPQAIALAVAAIMRGIGPWPD